MYVLDDCFALHFLDDVRFLLHVRARLFRAPFIHGPIAIVVDAIASLRGWLRGIAVCQAVFRADPLALALAVLVGNIASPM